MRNKGFFPRVRGKLSHFLHMMENADMIDFKYSGHIKTTLDKSLENLVFWNGYLRFIGRYHENTYSNNAYCHEILGLWIIVGNLYFFIDLKQKKRN